MNKNLAETGNPEEQKKEAPQVRSASCPIGYNPLLGEEASQSVGEDRNDHDRNDITHPDKPKAGGFMRQRTAVVNFVLGVVFHNPTHENGGAECCDHKADVAAHKVERIENVAIENAYVAPRTIGKNARQIAEQEDAADEKQALQQKAHDKISHLLPPVPDFLHLPCHDSSSRRCHINRNARWYFRNAER